MRVLVIKTSSLGDVVHTLPALTDASQALGDINFDWVVEESFAEIPAWHPAVDRVIPVALRRWRKHPIKAWTSGEWRRFKSEVRLHEYDKIIDAQGLLKSAWLTRKADGRRCGLAKTSAREPMAARFYHEHHDIARGQHAVDRVRQLFAACLGYRVPDTPPDYGLDKTRLGRPTDMNNYVVFLHGTTWASKHWPEAYWLQLASDMSKYNVKIVLPWGNDEERQRAQRIADSCDAAHVPDRTSLSDMAAILNGARAVVAVDTGLAHLAAALSVPTIGLYGATQPGLTGTRGAKQTHLGVTWHCAPCLQRQCSDNTQAGVTPPCYSTLTPDRVCRELDKVLA
ncbi:MAG: lipopolysaccharide heptosyltransferase I [Gammaproteobacteria bacterium]|nr:MAG: lipopolysaccharide heptosyltransferase I [Gammaproteobacteria bacterium]